MFAHVATELDADSDLPDPAHLRYFGQGITAEHRKPTDLTEKVDYKGDGP